MSTTAKSLFARSQQSSPFARTSNPLPTQARRFSWGGYALRGLATVVAAVLANTLFYFVGGAVVTYDPDFVILSNPSGAILFTLVPAIVAVLLYAALTRFTSRPAAIFTVISAIIFVITLIPDFTLIPTVPGSSTAQTAILVLMHVIAASVIVRLLTSTPARQPRKRPFHHRCGFLRQVGSTMADAQPNGHRNIPTG